MQRLLAGDPAAQAELFRRHRPSLWRQALKLLGNPALADEALQEGWTKGMEALHTFGGRSSFTTWITTVVLNAARTSRRREARFLPLSAIGPSEHGIAFEHEARRGERLDEAFTADDDTPEQLLLEKEAADRFEHALESLSLKQRAVLVLRDLEGKTPAQACAALRLTDLAHRIHLCRARARIRRFLEARAVGDVR